jgi:hypothetical protein
MAVCAEENALADLGAGSGKGPRMPSLADVESLQARIDVMEVKGANPAVIAAEEASSSRFLHELLLDPLPAFHNCGRTTSLAPVRSTSSRTPTEMALDQPPTRSV